MSELDELGRAAEPSRISAADQLRELRKANDHLKEIRKWIVFLGWVVLLYFIGSVLKIILDMLQAKGVI